MKKLLIFISAIYCFNTAIGQTVDSLTIHISESASDGPPWYLQSQYVDSFSTGLEKCELIRSWNGNQWINSTINYFSYDTSGALIQKDYLVWNTNQWINNSRWIYTYWTNSSLLTLLSQQWNGAAWVNKSLESHSFDANNNDTLILYSTWKNSAWLDSIKTERLFNANFFLSEATTSGWDTLSGSWHLALKNLYYPDSSGRDTTIINQFWNGTLWDNSKEYTYAYDSFSNVVAMREYWWINQEWEIAYNTSYSVNSCGKISGSSWDCYVGACGSASSYSLYDSLCNLAYTYNESTSMGGILSEFQTHWYYLSYPSSDTIYLITSGDFTICSEDSFHLGIFAFGGTPPLHFQWTPSVGLSSDTVENPVTFSDTTTTYSCTVTDLVGNTQTAEVTVTVHASPIVNITVQNVDSSSLCNSAVLVTDSLEYLTCIWSFNGIMQQNSYGYGAAHLLVDENGWYRVSVQNANGCTVVDSVEINFFSHPAPAVTIAIDCNTLVAQSTGIEGYQWYRNFSAIPGAILDTFPVLENDVYYVVVTDSDGCQNTSNGIYFRPWYASMASYPSCHDTCNGQLNGGAAYGTTPYTYLWSTGATSQHVYNLCAGIYSVTVTDARGCTAVDSDSLPFAPEFPIQVISSSITDSSLCNGVSFVTVSGQTNPVNYTYEWSSGSTVFNTGNLCSGWNYVAVISNNFGCTETDSFFVNINTTNDTCHAQASTVNPTCNGYCNGVIQLAGFTGAAPFNYFWIDPATGGSDSNLGGLCAGAYSLLLIDGAGCMDTLITTITEPDSIQGTFSILYANPNEPCSTLVGLSLVNDNPPSSIYWQCSGTIGAQTYTCPGNCNVAVQDQLGCTANFSFDVPDSITACSVIPLATNISCFGSCDGNITAIANGVSPFNYQWSTGFSGATVNSLCPGSYSVIMTDSVGCSDTATVVLTQPSAIASFITSSYLNCQCTFTANVTGGTGPYTYLWCNNFTTQQMLNCNAGLCYLNITDANGCPWQDSVMIIPSTPVTIAGSSTPASCQGCTDGTASGTVGGGTPPFTYVIQPGGTTNTSGIFTGLAAGNYNICVSDANGCTACTSVTVTQPMSCSVAIITVNSILCNGECTGSLTAVANGVPSFHFLWSTNDTTATINNLCAGSYTVVMTDSTGCIDTANAVLSEPSPLAAVFTTIYGCDSCVTFGTVTGGTPPYLYQWCDGSIGQQMFFCGPGICIVEVVDANGCIAQDTIALTPPPPLILTTQSNGTTCAGCNDGSITGNAAGGIPGYTYTLTPGGITNSSGIFTGLVAGMYQLCVTDANNCTLCDSISVDDDPTGIISASANNFVKIYPNPFKDETFLEVSAELLKSNPEFIISDLLGNIITSIPVDHQHTIVGRKNLSAGVYFYELRLTGNQSANGKLVIVN